MHIYRGETNKSKLEYCGLRNIINADVSMQAWHGLSLAPKYTVIVLYQYHYILNNCEL